jgi:hypothetical protein
LVIFVCVFIVFYLGLYPVLFYEHRDWVSLLFCLSYLLLKMSVFWEVALCSLGDIDGHFRGAYCLCHQGDDTPLKCQSTTRLYGASSQKTAYTHHCENLKSHIVNFRKDSSYSTVSKLYSTVFAQTTVTVR